MKRPWVLLVKPPERSRFNFGAFSLGVLAATIRGQAEVSIFDATDFAIDQAVQVVLAQQPDLVGVTAMGLASVAPVATFIHKLRRRSYDCAPVAREAEIFKIVAGGHGASMLPEVVLRAGADAVVIGEGELTLQQVLEEGIRPGVPGIACLDGDSVVSGPVRSAVHPLDRLPLPARDLMPSPPDGVHLMETSRGCPHACAFCEATRFHGRTWRPHSARRVALEVGQLVENYGAWMIHFADDNFAAHPARVLEICDRLKGGPLPAFFLASRVQTIS